MRLHRLFWLVCLLLAVTVLVLSAHIVALEWERADRATRGLEAIERLRHMLVAAEMASRERGPSNGLMGDITPGGDAVRLARLDEARARTDAAFSTLQQALDASGHRRDDVSAAVREAARDLSAGRGEISRIAQQPRSERRPDDIHAAIGRMFQVIEDLSPGLMHLMNEAQAAYPRASDALSGARLAAELREQAGRLGSQFTVALTARQPLRDSERTEIERLRGRVEQLRQLLVQRTAAAPERTAVHGATQRMLVRYFGSAMPFVEALTVRGRSDGEYDIDAAGFAARYVPDMDAIVELRDVLLEQALTEARVGAAEARTALVWISGGGLAALGLLGLTLWVVHHRVVRPLEETTELIVAIARGDLERTVPVPRHRDEVADVLKAIGVLRENSVARRALEDERQRLVEQLRDQSNTDFLTGLPNRRGFFTLAERHLPNLQRHGYPVAIALFDIDHFKQVNDSWGHAVGDVVLGEVARCCQQHSRRGDVIARYGGEEFILLMPHCDLASATAQAERLRVAIESTVMQAGDAGGLKVTASFGVAECLLEDDTLDPVIARADACLYRAKREGRNRVVAQDGA
jgi:diguanylate cyclase (GGDEF)-like protein